MPQWEVVGGGDKGGILAREGADLKSAATADRLSTGAVVEQLESVGERLHYKLQSGTGPETGWVSLKLSGKDLLVPYEQPAAPADPAEWPARHQAVLSAEPAEGATLKESAPWMSSVGKAPPKARVRLVIFNWTGNRGGAGSAHNFSKWPKMLGECCPPETWQVCEVRYPGRSSRMKEPNATAAREIATAAAEAIKKAGPPMPTVLFGFSFGAILAYETAVLLSKRGLAPHGLVVASAEHPGWEWRRWGVGAEGAPTRDTSDEAFEKVLKDKGGTDVILNQPEMKKMYLPVIRSDMIMEEAYGAALPQHEKLPCPIVVFRGKECPLIPRADVDPWLELTGCGEGTPTRVEELSTGLAPVPIMSPWLSDWYLCQGDQSTDAMVKAIARDFGGAAA
uniref:Thioesterase domain-containing protein n=1 Tax=Alexandrium catenella TaxID=2925 RepID=A0A7S1RZV7_ALECA